MEIICGIYKITSPSKKIYIGQSRDILHRFKNYYRYECKGQTHLYSSLKKHSIDKHKFEILEQCLPKELNDKEIYYIELYQCFNSKFGLNLMSGGSFGTHSVETKRKIGEATKRIHTGLKRSQSTKDKIREKALGRKISQETIQKIKETRIKNGGYHHSQETIEKIKYSNINLKPTPQAIKARNEKCSRKVYTYCIETSKYKYFISTKNCASFFNVCPPSIFDRFKRYPNKIYKGYVLSRTEEELAKLMKMLNIQ